MDFELFDPKKESYTKYVNRLEKCKLKIYSDKYNEILSILNKVFHTENNSLSDFKNITDELVDEKLDDLIKLLLKSTLFKEDLVELLYNYTERNGNQGIYIIRNMLSQINYIIFNKEYNGKKFYRIKKN